jgi:hypothetical protein
MNRCYFSQIIYFYKKREKKEKKMIPFAMDQDTRESRMIRMIIPVLTRYGCTISASKFLIKKNRKIGFIISLGKPPTSRHHFESMFAVPSVGNHVEDNLDCDGQRIRLCFFPDGFMIAGVMGNCIYLGEVLYREKGDGIERVYVFHRVEHDQIVFSSSPCFTPGRAFDELWLALPGNEKLASLPGSERVRHNGKLYMGISYSATQNLLRNDWKTRQAEIPKAILPLFLEWMGQRTAHVKGEDDLFPRRMYEENKHVPFLLGCDSPLIFSPRSFSVLDDDDEWTEEEKMLSTLLL